MSFKIKTLIPMVGMLFLFGVAAIAVTRHARQLQHALPKSIGDLTKVKLIEIRDASGQQILRGAPEFTSEPDGDIAGFVVLEGLGTTEAVGQAELEVSDEQKGVREQELEIEIKNLTPNATFSLYVDDKQVATFKSNSRGLAELELKNHHP